MIQKIITQIESFAHLKYDQFKAVNDGKNQARIIAKTIAIAGLFSGSVGLFCGKKIRSLTFLGTAIYVGSNILDRVSQPEFSIKQATHLMTQKGNQGIKIFEDGGIGIFRFIEDIWFPPLTKKQENEKKLERISEDLYITLKRLFQSALEEIKYTMSF